MNLGGNERSPHRSSPGAREIPKDMAGTSISARSPHQQSKNQQSIPIPIDADADADVADADQIQTNMTMAMSFRFLSDAIYFTHHSMELQHQAQRVSLAILQVFPT